MNLWTHHLYDQYMHRCNCEPIVGRRWMMTNSICLTDYISQNTKSFECRLKNKCMTADEYLASHDTSSNLQIEANNKQMPRQMQKELETKLKMERLAYFKQHGSFKSK